MILERSDVGCASGYFTFYAAEIGNQSVGIDVDERGNRKAKRLAQILGFYKTYFLLLDIRILDRFAEQLGKFDQDSYVSKLLNIFAMTESYLKTSHVF